MKAEIIAVGTELLLGQITNTNAQYLSQQLANLGVDVYFQTVVGDNEIRLKEAFHLASHRADLVICTGGLGPTQDDITKDVLAAFCNLSLQIHQPTLDKITSYYIKRSIPMVESNARQSIVMADSDPLLNDVGMAVGLAINFKQTSFVLLPGPPREMKVMFDKYTIPWIKSQLTNEIPLFSKIYKFAGIGESSLEQKLEDLIRVQQDPTIAPYAKEGEVAIRLTTRAVNAAEGIEKLSNMESLLRERLGSYIYADEDISIEEAIVKILTVKNLTLSAAESCSGGMLSDMITTCRGSSLVYKGAIICYTNEMKHLSLKIPMTVLEGAGTPGAISSETALLMAQNLMDQTQTDFVLSITGVAGPDSVEDKPVGLVYIGIAEKGKEAAVKEVQLTGNRDMIKLKAAKHALYMLWEKIK